MSLKIDLGAAAPCIPGFDRYVDRVPCHGVPADKMVVADLNQKWPFADNSVTYFRACDIIEHLVDKIHTMNEIHRCLAKDGSVDIVVPTTDGSGAFQDPTHISFWNRRSFLYYESGNPYRERFYKSYGITAAFRVLRENIERTMDGPKLNILLGAVK